MTFRFHPDNTLPKNGEVFVFGSNLAGRHGKGAALIARQRFGARYGVGEGFMEASSGASCYAVPTKDHHIRSMPLEQIIPYINELKSLACGAIKDKTFFITRVGCGLAGNRDEDVAPLFADFPPNCIFPDEWKPFLPAKKNTRTP